MKTIEVVAAVIVKDGRIFATQRGYGDFKDFWEFPGGKIEPGESPEDALKREIKEELDADISVDSFLQTVEYDYPKFHLILHCFLCRLKNDTLHLLEHESARWLSANELDSVEWLPADLSIIHIIRQVL
ncbi:MAG: (deoxy)nucleoside triphosphate pyrophosphohydrolase [Bacteroidales bacterium]|nr:(deoxy)nucleoside triphosphate pyrophosphohydrolase [Bacteroidales bacterium]